MNAPSSRPLIHIVSDGRAGMENQARGLAEALCRLQDFDTRLERIDIKDPWRNLPGFLWGDPMKRLVTPLDLSPLPDIWIACGRLTLPFAGPMRTRGSFVVQLQDPRKALHNFDVVVPPEHDNLQGQNVLPMRGSPNRLTEELLREDASRLLPFIGGLPSPRIAVMLGGDSRAYKMSEARQQAILENLTSLRDGGAGLLITSSRRTPASFVSRLREVLSGPNIFQWHGDNDLKPGFNPYFGLLGLADHILVTEESTNMVTEAAFTGKPVHLIALDGGNDKFRRFHESLQQAGISRPLALPLQSWTYAPLRETDRIAEEILVRWRSHLQDRRTHTP